MSLGKLVELMKAQKITFSQDTVYTILSDISIGMHYLHLRGFIHRDLNMGNFLFSSDFVLKISDFGESRQFLGNDNKYDYKIDATADKGALLFRAPEAHTNTYDKRCDIWSVGIVLSKILEVNYPPNIPIFRSDKTTWFEESITETLIPNVTYDVLQFLAFTRATALDTTTAFPELRPWMEGCLKIVPSSRLSFCELIILLEEIKVTMNAKIVRAFPVEEVNAAPVKEDNNCVIS